MAYLGDFDQSTPQGRILRSALQSNEQADLQLKNARSMLIQLRTGDGSSLDHYADIVKFLHYGGYTSTQGDPTDEQLTMARDSFLETDSAYSKTSGNGSVTDVRAARDQWFDKHRG